MVSTAVKLFGTEQVNEPLRTLRAGPLSVQFDNGALRYVRIGSVEVIRAIAFLVRDENWGTFTPQISGLTIDEKPGSFLVRFTASCTDAARTLVYDAEITGSEDGSLSYVALAEPVTDVLTNRTGFIVLHPVEGVAGNPVRVLHVDGREVLSSFPAAVDPRCPFTDIRALSHEFAPGAWVTCTMEGDAFEMEDQRNWSDASYKTYVRPLRLPWPYTLNKGEPVRQAVRLHIRGNVPRTTGEAGSKVPVSLGEEAGTMPLLGLGVPAGEAVPALDRQALLERLSPNWLVCQVDLRDGRGLQELGTYRALGESCGAPVTLEIVTKGSLDPQAELQEVADAARRAGLEPEAVEVFAAQDMVSMQPDAKWPPMPSFAETYAAARKAFPGVRLGGGMATYFTELNRKRPPAGALDYVTFTTCPTVHAADDISVMETNEAIAHLVGTTRAFMGDALPIRIGPSQIGCRENPYGKSTAPNPGNGRVCLSAMDPRQRGLFNAAWMLAYVAACARSGVEAVALGAPTGQFGHIHRRMDFSQPWYDELDVPAVYPGFHLLADLARLGGAIRTGVEVRGAGLAALAARHAGGQTLWIANLTAEPLEVEVAGPAGKARIAIMDADAFERVTTDLRYIDAAQRDFAGETVRLAAHALARIVWP